MYFTTTSIVEIVTVSQNMFWVLARFVSLADLCYTQIIGYNLTLISYLFVGILRHIIIIVVHFVLQNNFHIHTDSGKCLRCGLFLTIFFI